MNRIRRVVLVLSILTLWASAVSASDFCFEEAGAEYGVPPGLLWAIAKVESEFDPGAIGRTNSNGSFDFGVMQINSWWASKIGPELWNSLGDPCTNIKVGAWILSDCIQRYGYTWQGIGCYNASSRDKRAKYSKKVIQVWREALTNQEDEGYAP